LAQIEDNMVDSGGGDWFEFKKVLWYEKQGISFLKI
jgi:hypothetical protein